jgi:hypothetical protein
MQAELATRHGDTHAEASRAGRRGSEPLAEVCTGAGGAGLLVARCRAAVEEQDADAAHREVAGAAQACAWGAAVGIP